MGSHVRREEPGNEATGYGGSKLTPPQETMENRVSPAGISAATGVQILVPSHSGQAGHLGGSEVRGSLTLVWVSRCLLMPLQ